MEANVVARDATSSSLQVGYFLQSLRHALLSVTQFLSFSSPLTPPLLDSSQQFRVVRQACFFSRELHTADPSGESVSLNPGQNPRPSKQGENLLRTSPCAILGFGFGLVANCCRMVA